MNYNLTVATYNVPWWSAFATNHECLICSVLLERSFGNSFLEALSFCVAVLIMLNTNLLQEKTSSLNTLSPTSIPVFKGPVPACYNPKLKLFSFFGNFFLQDKPIGTWYTFGKLSYI